MPCLALMYHRVNTLDHDPWTTCVSPPRFDQQLAVIRSLNAPVEITFDDGYADNLEHALPLLEKHRLPATIFVTSGMVGSPYEMWWDDLERKYLRHTPSAWDWEDDDPDLGATRYREWFHRCRAISVPNPAGQPLARPSHRMLTVGELRAVSAHPLITIGAHTVHHPVLSALSPDEQRWEIEESKRQLEAMTGRGIHVFAYPNGARTDYSADTVWLVRQAGFHKAYAAWDGVITVASDPFQLPRMMVRDWSGEVFAAELHKNLSLLPSGPE